MHGYEYKIVFFKTSFRVKLLQPQKRQQGYQTHLYIYGDHTFIGDRAQGYSQW